MPLQALSLLSKGLLLLFITLLDIVNLMASTGSVGYKRVRPRLSAVIQNQS